MGGEDGREKDGDQNLKWVKEGNPIGFTGFPWVSLRVSIAEMSEVQTMGFPSK